MIGQNCNECNDCNGCGQSSGCGLCCGRRELFLSPIECEILRKFAEIPFLPVGFSGNSAVPFCMDFEGMEGEYSNALLVLEQKMLISIDAGIPLEGFDYSDYSDCPIHGSMALTGYGQMILDQIDCRSMEEESC